MSKPPKKAIEQIKNYCEKTQCLRCVFGYKVINGGMDYICCSLQENVPCDWNLEKMEGDDV